MPNILHAIGNSPLVKLNKIPQSMGIKCNMCKFLITRCFDIHGLQNNIS